MIGNFETLTDITNSICDILGYTNNPFLLNSQYSILLLNNQSEKTANLYEE